MTVTFADIEAAAARIEGLAVKTPLIESPALNERIGTRVLLKPETLQRGGAFKFRGAMNKIAQLDEAARRRGVVACSSGNHAQGVALAARMLGAPATIVMPADAPAMKVANTKAYGAEVIHYDRYTQDRDAITMRISEERGMTIVWPFNDEDIVAGQGTVGLELAAQAEAAGARLGLVLAPVGGGGLMAGVSTAIRKLAPTSAVIGVEPADFDDTRRSLESGRLEKIDPAARGICDALQSPSPGPITFAINSKTLDGIATVTDAEVAEAIRYAYTALKLVVEPGGAVGLAALLSGAIDVEGVAVGVVLSGGNIDPELFTRILAGEI